MNKKTSNTYTFNAIEQYDVNCLPIRYPAVIFCDGANEKIYVPDLKPYTSEYLKKNGLENISDLTVLCCNFLSDRNAITTKSAAPITKLIKGTKKVLIGFVVKN